MQLDLSNSLIRDLSASTLAFAPNLQYLNIQSLELTNIDSVFNLQSLNTLIASSNKIDVVNIPDTFAGTGFQQLDLAYNDLTSITGLVNLGTLEHLDIRSPRLADLSFLPEGFQIQNLSIGGEQLVDVSQLGNVTDLRYLYIESASAINGPVGTIAIAIAGKIRPQESAAIVRSEFFTGPKTDLSYFGSDRIPAIRHRLTRAWQICSMQARYPLNSLGEVLILSAVVSCSTTSTRLDCSARALRTLPTIEELALFALLGRSRHPKSDLIEDISRHWAGSERWSDLVLQ